MELNFVTSNRNKVREAEEILQTSLEQEEVELKEIQSIDIREVVEDKAERAYKKLNKPVIVDDTGIFLDALDGFPGALTKWVMESLGVKGLCKLVEEERGAKVRTAVGFCSKEDLEVFVGEVKGKIAERPLGDSGFGFDPVFVPEGYSRSFAQLGTEVKNKISMRKKAFLKLKEFLKEK